MSGKPRSAYQKLGRPRPPMPTAQERMERKRKAKEQPKVDYYLAQKAKALSYDYAGIPEEHRELVQRAALDIRSRLKRTVEDVIAIGKQLIEIQPLMEGKFTAWFTKEFNMDERSARNFIYAAEKFGDRPEIISGLDVTTVYLLAAPSTPDTVRWEVFERMEMLDFRPTHAQVKEIIAAHKRPKEPKQLTGPEPEPAITAEYEIAPSNPPQRSPQEIAAELSLSECLMVLELAKEAAKRARELAPATVNSVTDVLPSISRLIHKIEQELRK